MKKNHKKKALHLRSRGFSIKEIAVLLNVAQSTVSVWVRRVKLNRAATTRLHNRSVYGRMKAIETNRKRRVRIIGGIRHKARGVLKKVKWNKSLGKVCASLLYWCEGSKQARLLCFTNSDVWLAKTFLSLLRRSFDLDEKKFRVCLHLHSYHDIRRQIKFWSTATKIPVAQFMRVHQKQNGGTNIKKGYPGCASIRYYDYRVFQELKSIWEGIARKYGGLV